MSSGGNAATPAEPADGAPKGQPPKGPLMNGLRTLPELPALSVDPAHVAPLSLPLEALTFRPTSSTIITHFKNKDRERKIYCNIELDPHEKELLRQLQEEANAQGLEFLPEITVMTMRFMSRARGDIAKCIRLMHATQNWRLEHFKNGPICCSDVIEDMKHGIVYFGGRDSALRPAIVVRCCRVPKQWYRDNDIGRLLRILIFCMEYMMRYMVLPGKIENNCLIVDLKGLSLAQVSISALQEIYGVMSHHYIGRVFKFYICNLAWPLSTILGMATSLLTDRQKQKLVMVDKVKDLQKEFALHQLEEDLGGTRPIIKEFFPFQMQAGPFEAGCTSGPQADPVPCVHERITKAGFFGHLWDPSLTKFRNLAVEYVPEAPEYFQRLGVAIPPDCLTQGTDVAGGSKNGANGFAGGADAPPCEASHPVHKHEIEEAAGPDLEDKTEVKPGGLFSCAACICQEPGKA